MVFAHDTEVSLQAAVALVNTAVTPETLTTVAEADAFWTTWEYTGRHERTRAELDDIRALRPVLREVLTSERDRSATLVNELLAEAGALPQLVRHDEWDWHLHAIAPDRPWAQRIMVETAMAMIDVVRSDEMSRLGVCADDDCDGLVLDLSRNRSRRFCSTTCGNRAAVAAYRARQG
ncbi:MULTISPECIES: CGNR zinc finger domain-containing protein [unclassified Nocardioides]|uniref:CGNR zinc finger domain-containing protein n=1 Tax=unclassified Nocardioides TaxID=2615069 RepID=UPI0006F78DD0|nr:MULTISPECIES: CGNR zinc finger domain-containing protein [unclassified Nocardioides]KQY54528.1 RNA-binding protein [Nocardioides sp. Root140]KQZ66403.1 RNA-binding protein [Nocardioides sp. Root151]KRF19603.1 RNA-binding protein [Nocardioides sp. Soil796]